MNSLYFDVKTFDELAELQDSMLASRMRNLRRLIEQSYKQNLPARSLEVEMCYAERESAIRARRQEIHSRYASRHVK